jgi:chemotaxis protein CheC
MAAVTGKEHTLDKFLAAARSGVSRAAEALATISANAIQMEVISAGLAPTARLSEIVGDPEDTVAGVYIRVTGDIPGHALLMFPYKSALLLGDLVTGQVPGSTVEMTDMERSLLQEVGNIVVSSYVNAISEFFKCSLLPSPPCLAVDMGAAVIDSVLLYSGQYEEDTINIVTRFAGDERSVRGFFLYIPEISD